MTDDLNNSNISSGSSDFSDVEDGPDCKAPIEKDFYGCYCLKFRVKHGTSIAEERIIQDFGLHGTVLKVWGAGVINHYLIKDKSNEEDLHKLDTVVYVWLKKRDEAEASLEALQDKYHELTPAISDVLLPDNFGYYSISFKNMVSVPTEQIYKEFSEFGYVRNVSGCLDVREGRVFISFRDKEAATRAFIHKTERWYHNMRFEFPKCERDYTGCYCLKFYNNMDSPYHATEEEVRKDFGNFGHIVDIRGPGLFETHGNDVYVRYREKASAQAALLSLVSCYSGLSITPATDILPDKFGCYAVTFVNKAGLNEQEIHSLFQQYGQLAQVAGNFCSPSGRVFVSYTCKEGAAGVLRAMVDSKHFRLQLARGSKPGKGRCVPLHSGRDREDTIRKRPPQYREQEELRGSRGCGRARAREQEHHQPPRRQTFNSEQEYYEGNHLRHLPLKDGSSSPLYHYEGRVLHSKGEETTRGFSREYGA